MAAIDKPLPEAPQSQTDTAESLDLTRLAVEARAHLRQFIRHALAEENVDSQREWATSLELALKELCDSMSRGNWLSGSKVSHLYAMERRRLRQDRILAEQEKASKDTDVKKKGKAKEEKEKAGADSEADKEKENISEENQKDQNDVKAKKLSPEERKSIALAQIQEALVTHLTPAPKATAAHLLLMLSPKGAILPIHDMDFDIVPSSRMCVFTADRFVLPSAEEMRRNAIGNFLYGLEEWDVDQDDLREVLPKVVGGTFSFTGLNSSQQYQSLAKVLRLSIYVCLSLILEQHVLIDSHIHLHFPAPIVAQPMVFSYTTPPISPGQDKIRAEKNRGGLWSFLAKKTESFFSKSSNLPPATSVSRTKSLETHSRPGSEIPNPPSIENLKNGSIRPRRLSLNFHTQATRASHSLKTPPENLASFSSALARISATSSILSTSAGINFPLPRVLVRLADREREEPNRRLFGYEKVALASLLGWEGRESAGRGMSGMTGFMRHQIITFLYAEYAPRRQEEQKISASTSVQTERDSNIKPNRVGTPTPSSSPTDHPINFVLVPCSRPRWVTYRYFNRAYDDRKVKYTDKILGDAIQSLCLQAFDDDNRNVKCEESGCETSKADHRHIWIHNGLRVMAEITRSKPGEENIDSDLPIYMWESCDICQKTTQRKTMSDGTYLYSFGKYLELLLYSPALCSLSPWLCEHTTPPPHPWPTGISPPTSRFNIVRIFEFGKREVRFRTSLSPTLFDVRIPLLQILRGRYSESSLSKSAKLANKISISTRKSDESDDEKIALRKEIKQWWQGVSDHLDKLDERFSDAETFRKALPRLPSDYSTFNEDISVTPKVAPADISLPLSVPTSPGHSTDESGSGEQTPTISKFLNLPAYPVSRESPKEELDSAECLSNLRHSFQRSEQDLYAQLSNTSSANLNEVRRSFADVSKGASLRLSAWEKKHCNEEMKKEIEEMHSTEPEWWKPTCHAVPGGKVIVREDEVGSVIAFTLSSIDYRRELDNMNSPLKTPSSQTQSTVTTMSSPTPSTAPNSPTFSSLMPLGRPKTPAPKELDPDDETAVWHEPDAYSSSILRYDQPRDQSGLMSLREVLRNRRSLEPTGSAFLTASKFSPAKLVSAISGSVPTSPRVVSGSNVTTPPSAWAEPAVEVSMQAAGGQVSGLPEVDTAEKMLQEVEASADAGSGSSFFPSSWKNAFQSAEPKPRRPPSLISVESDYTTTTTTEGPTPSSTFESPEQTGSGGTVHSTLTSVPETTSVEEATNKSIIDRTSQTSYSQSHWETVPESSTKTTESFIKKGHQHHLSSTIGTTTSTATTALTEASAAASVASTLTSTVTNAMRYLMKGAEVQRATSPAHHHKLLALENNSTIAEDRPHIKYDWTVGKRVRFSCTVYYAKQFEVLRRRCGVESIFTKSLSRSENWAPEGGKSRSNFMKTLDNRFVIKTLVNAWNVADLQVLIELAPAYFRYMESTANRPSVLAKLLGFYTIEIKGLENGGVHSKADLLVMENVFYDQTISKTFDLKGIQGRRVKATGKSTSGRKTFFDGDWIEEQQKGLVLVHPDSKLILHEAIKADADFLCRNNIMDYSLLLSVDEEKRQMACGLIDMIGSYTFAKTLEYKAKQGLAAAGREPTVIPPTEYHDRFVNAMNNYFLACPDKWTRPSYDSSDYDFSLPSVL